MHAQQLDAARLTPEQVDQHQALNAAAIHHIGPLLQKGAAITHADLVKQAIGAVQAGTLTADQAASFVDNMKGTPRQMQANLNTAMSRTLMANIAFAALKQRMGGAGQPPTGAVMPQPTPAGASGTA